MTTEARWARVNAGLNLVVIALLILVASQMRGQRAEGVELREQLKAINERLERHIAAAVDQEGGAKQWGRTAGGQEGL